MVTRRSFIKGAGIIATAPLLTGTTLAEELLPAAAKKNVHKILTCNIRVDLPDDEKIGFGWEGRRDICADIMRRQKPDIMCMQEVLRNQNEDLKKAFPGFFSFGFEGPEMDGPQVGYQGIAKNPIFYSTKRYELMSAGGFWLSETPLVAGSLSWDTARARHANWVRLKDRHSGKEFRVVNLHLDHKSQPARMGQIKVVEDEAKQYQKNFPQILTGDFNASMSNGVYTSLKQAGWVDSHTALHGEAEPGYTVHQFLGDKYPKKDTGRKIDFIFYKGEGISALSSGIIRDAVNGRYPSDHYFVGAELKF
jgi:endonuclease/exonuclease/phosphatase family metal-dependent hydrolase